MSAAVAGTVAPTWTADEAAEIWAMFRARACSHCGGLHARACPRVRSMSWHPNGQLAGVRFWPDGKWDDAAIQWPESLPAEET